MNVKRVSKLLITVVFFVVSATYGFTYAKGISSYYSLRSDVGELKSQLDSDSSFSNCINTPSLLASSLERLPYVSGELLITQLKTTSSGAEDAKSITLEELKSAQSSSDLIEVSITSSNIEELLKYLANEKLAYEYLDVTDNVVTIRVYMKEV